MDKLSCASSVLASILTLAFGLPSYEDNLRLNEKLLANYSRLIRPIENQDEALKVSVAFVFKGVSNFDEMTGVITIVGGLLYSWKDARITWDPNDYGQLDDIALPASYVWIPVLNLINTADNMQMTTDTVDVYFDHDGSAFATTGFSFNSLCTPNTRKFPFDIHECDLTFTTRKRESTMNIFSNGVVNSEFTDNPKWQILRVRFVNNTEEYSQSVQLEIVIRRRPMFLMVTLVFPIMLLSFVNLFVFLLPAESGERVSFSITVLLSFTVYITMISDKMPHSSINIPLLCIYLLSTLIYSCFVTLATIYSMRVHYTEKFESLQCLLRYCTMKSLTSMNKIGNSNTNTTDHKATKKDIGETENDDNNETKVKTAGKITDYSFLFVLMFVNLFMIILFLSAILS